jgi:hypothetical protein
MKIQNVVGSSDKDSPCGSWIKYWRLHKTDIFTEIYLDDYLCPFCKNKLYSEGDFVGGHVREVTPAHKQTPQYILPICSDCNKVPGKQCDIDDSMYNHLRVPVPSRLTKE